MSAGRKTKFTPGTVEALLNAIENGLSITDACRIADISTDTYENWKREKSDFSADIEKAQATFKKNNLDAIYAASVQKTPDGVRGSWQANAWLLERRFPKEFGRTIDMTSDGERMTGLIINAGDDDGSTS